MLICNLMNFHLNYKFCSPNIFYKIQQWRQFSKCLGEGRGGGGKFAGVLLGFSVTYETKPSQIVKNCSLRKLVGEIDILHDKC